MGAGAGQDTIYGVQVGVRGRDPTGYVAVVSTNPLVHQLLLHSGGADPPLTSPAPPLESAER